MLLGQKLNFRRPQCRKLFFSWFINAVHLAHAPIIGEENDLHRALFPLLVLAAPSVDKQTPIFIFPKKKKKIQVVGV